MQLNLDNDVTFASVEGSGAFSIPDTFTLTTGDNGKIQFQEQFLEMVL